MDFTQARRLAELRRRSSVSSAFVAAHTDDAGRAREARRLAEQVLAAGAENLETAEGFTETLDNWAYHLSGAPSSPTEERPVEADRQVHDHHKDVLRDHLPVEFHDWMSETRALLDTAFDALGRASAPDAQMRQDASYLFGRATMALELGHREAAEHDLKRLRGLWRRCSQPPLSTP